MCFPFIGEIDPTVLLDYLNKTSIYVSAIINLAFIGEIDPTVLLDYLNKTSIYLSAIINLASVNF